jgi:hypothetical protein
VSDKAVRVTARQRPRTKATYSPNTRTSTYFHVLWTVRCPEINVLMNPDADASKAHSLWCHSGSTAACSMATCMTLAKHVAHGAAAAPQRGSAIIASATMIMAAPAVLLSTRQQQLGPSWAQGVAAFSLRGIEVELH